MLKINDRFYLDSDNYNIILVEVKERVNSKTGEKYLGKDHIAFFNNIKVAVLHIADILIREKLKSDIEFRDLIIYYDKLREELSKVCENCRQKP